MGKTYSFESENGRYQLVKTRQYRKYWFLKKEEKIKLPVHIKFDIWEKLILYAEDKTRSASNELNNSIKQNSIEASLLRSILKNLGITPKILLEAKLPSDKHPEIVDQLANTVNQVFAGRG